MDKQNFYRFRQKANGWLRYDFEKIVNDSLDALDFKNQAAHLSVCRFRLVTIEVQLGL